MTNNFLHSILGTFILLKKIHRIFLFWLFITTIANAATSCQEHHCLAVVDAGSTGSRLHIYAYDVDKQNNPIKIEQVWSNKVKPGFASIEPSQAVVDTYLTNLFANSPEQNVPVYFYATAGMRLVSTVKQKIYYDALKQWAEKNTQSNVVIAKTITGREEGVFGWLAVNYKLGTLQSKDKPLLGVMDMGGASVQITFPAEQTNTINSNDLVSMDIYNRHITLFSHSFLGLGQTEMSHQYFNDSSCFSNDYPLPNGEIGTGNAQTCQHKVSKLINDVHQVRETISPALQGNKISDWYTISGLSTLVKNKPFNFEKNQFTSQDLLEIADNELCRTSWYTLLEQYPSNDYTYVNCLTSSYYYALLANGYGLEINQMIHYLSDEEEVDWTLGVVFSQLTHVPLAK